MGTPDFAVPTLARLIMEGYDVAAVFTQPDKPSGRGKHLHEPPVKSLAVRHGISVHQPTRIKTSEEVRHTFESIAPDACVVVAYGKILPAWMLEIPRLGCINVHASLLPKYRGAAPINWAIANGETETGITIMQMDAGMDTGPMLSRKVIEIRPDETALDLSGRLSLLGASLLSETLPRVERGDVVPEIQDDTKASYAPMLKRENGLIDWHRTAARIANRVRAFQPWPGSYTFFSGQRIVIWRVTVEATAATETAGAGHVIQIDHHGFDVACGDQTRLRVEEVQAEGKRRMTAREFANGSGLSVGAHFDSPKARDSMPS
jgi:methionyl-tRNA formyltransferase